MPDRIGPYVVDREVGRGGMGVVYLARDPELDRDVAIKALPDDVAEDPDRLARFEREAKALAALNHSGIGAIYGLEKIGDHRYLVLEYVPGETLDAVLARGPIPVADALPVALQIAEAIEHAHRSNLLHRDLKPANIKFAEDNRIKVLDFGLAKACEEPGVTASGMANSPTYVPAHTPTMPGVILGSAGYLSPEQARGRAVDRGSDIFSFGCVLYEMLTGARAFPGETVTDSLGATLHREPEWDRLPPDTPPTVQLLLRRCLVKDRRRRLQDIGDARIELEAAIADPTSSSLGLASAALAAAAPSSPGVGRRLLSVAILLVVATAAAAAAWGLRPAPERPLRHYAVMLDANEILTLDWPFKGFDLSPSGNRLAYGTRVEAGSFHATLVVHDLEHADVRTIGSRVYVPRFSPDGNWLAFFQAGQETRSIRRVPVGGGASQLVCPIDGWLLTLDWAKDDTLALHVLGDREDPSRVLLVPAAGGEPEPLELPAEIAGEDVDVGFPHFLPDGSGLIVTIMSEEDWDHTSLVLYRRGDGSATRIIDGGVDGRVLASGHLLFRNRTTLMAAPFDSARGVLTAPPVSVLEDVGSDAVRAVAPIVVDPTGTLAYLPGVRAGGGARQLAWADDDGSLAPILPDRRDWDDHAVAPDFGPGHGRIAATVYDRETTRFELNLIDVERELVRRLASDAFDPVDPVWATHEGADWIIFSALVEGEPASIHRVRADFSGAPELLLAADEPDTDRIRPCHVSPDGRRLLVQDPDRRLLSYPLRADGTIDGDPLVLAPDGNGARFSPDGAWVAYRSNESGRNEIYVRAADGTGPAEQVSLDGARGLRWSPTAEEVLIMNRGARAIDAVPYTVDDGTFRPGTPRRVVNLDRAGNLGGMFDVHPDGTRFSINTHLRDEATVALEVVLNWTEELKRRVPVD